MGISTENHDPLDRSANFFLIILPLLMFVATALRTSGNVST